MNSEIEVIPDGKFAPEDWEYILLQMVSDRSGVDFSMYRLATFRRRYLKHMNLTDSQDIRDYVKMLEDSPEQLDLLVSDLLIGVTSFFRDTAAFRVLQDSVIKPLFLELEKEPVRAWVAGCSVGMEAYSIALLMDSVAGENGRNFTIFATDISRSALASASRGVFSEKQFKTVPEEYRGYFTETEKGWRISREIRSHMIFSYHDVLADPPFAHMDIVSCRNMMIYLKPKAQDIVLGRLNYSLSRGGYLFLGSGETPGQKHANLEVVDSRWRLFKKISDTIPSVDIFPLEKHYSKSGSTFSTGSYKGQSEEDVFGRSRSFTSCLEERFFPDCVFIDDDYKILFINGDLNSFLSIPSGIPGGSILPMLPSRLKAAVRTGVRRATGLFRRIQCDTGDSVSIFVSCVSPPGMKGVFLVEFIRNDPEGHVSTSSIECRESGTSILEEQIALLESELASIRRELRSRTGELQASNEELQTTNEEIRSANEELTASNEELIASNEELQRVNHQLAVLSDDMTNLLESMDVGSLFLDTGLNIRRFNPTVCDFFKITDKDIGRTITDFTTTIAKPSMDSLIETVQMVACSGETAEISLEAGLPGYWLAKVSPYRTSEGAGRGTVITFIDITLLRQGEISLAGSERKFRGLFNGFPVGSILVSHAAGSDELTILDRNPEFEKIEMEHSDIAANDLFIHGILHEERVFQFINNHSTFLCEVFRPVDYAETLCVTVRNITSESQASHEKEMLQKRLKDAQLLAGMGTWEYDPSEEMITLSDEAADLFDLSSANPVPAEAFRKLIENADVFFDDMTDALSRGDMYSGMVTMRGVSSRGRKFFRVNSYPVRDRSGTAIYGYALDVTSGVKSEIILKEAHDKLAETQRIAKIGLIEMEWNETYSLHRENFSDSACRVLKLPIGTVDGFFRKHMDEELAVTVLRALKEGAQNRETVSMDVPVRNGLGENVFIQLIARPDTMEDGKSGTTIVIMDITRRHQLENELKHSDKLRSVGELAGGIAHDFNNQLMGIVGFAECLMNLSLLPEQIEYVKGILGSAERAGALVRQLLAFSRKGLSNISPFNLHHQIDDVISLLRRSIDRRIEILRVLRAEDAIILGDASEMNNALLNIAINARDAMEGSGTLTFSTRNHEPGKIELAVTDTGRGMTPEVLQKAFEPFFTTKPLGDGTGMGLPAVYGTVNAHNGSVTIESDPGKGTRVVVVLPVSDMDAASDESRKISSSFSMDGTILLVDDEQIVRTVLKTLIESLGFSVITATDGLEAVDLFRKNRDKIKLVLMDMTMPRMNGIDAFNEMAEITPGVKVIILSGHSAESTAHEMINLGIVKVLQKPVTISVLAAAIREIIAG